MAFSKNFERIGYLFTSIGNEQDDRFSSYQKLYKTQECYIFSDTEDKRLSSDPSKTTCFVSLLLNFLFLFALEVHLKNKLKILVLVILRSTLVTDFVMQKIIS